MSGGPEAKVALEVRVGELKQFFNAMDAAPFHDRDLDPAAEEFIVSWAEECRRAAPLELVVRTERDVVTPEAAAVLRDAVHEFFGRRSEATRRRMRRLLRTGRTSLLISLIFLGFAIAIGDFVASGIQGEHYAHLVREGFLIGGWVAMWRPLEIFLYDWWPIRAEARLFDRLAAMTVSLAGAAGEGSR